MFLRATIRKKDGKEHRYWSIVENIRVGRRVRQRHVLYLGEINSSQELAWLKSIEVLEESADQPRTLALFPEDRCEGLLPDDESIVRLKLSDLRLCRPRQWGACWLAQKLWQELELDRFWARQLAPSRKGTRWDQVLFILVVYRLLSPRSEWRLYRQWFERSALADLMVADDALADIHKLYDCHDRLLEHKSAVFDHLVARWRDLFNVTFDVLLYDLTSTYFEADPPFPKGDKRRFGYARDRRPDCVQVVIALVVTPEGLPLAYEVLAGNTQDRATLRDFLARGGSPTRTWPPRRLVASANFCCGAGRGQRPVEGQVVLLSGEPGIGKSRLTAALLERLAAEPHTRLRYFCSPQHTDSALFPVIGQLTNHEHPAVNERPSDRYGLHAENYS
jgi:hypothetical protein